MKFIHCADLHLDSKLDSLPSEKAKIRRGELVKTFERLCEFATANAVTAVIIVGDMFDTSRVTVKTRARVLHAIAEANKVDFIYLSGNHDDENFIADTLNLPVNLKVVGDKWKKFSYGNVEISGVTLNSVNIASVYDELKLDENKFNIVSMHGQIVGYKSSETAENISIPRLKDKNIDYLALGHIHSMVEGQIDLRGKYAYCGCLDGRGFDETGEKGFILIDVKDDKAIYEFVEFSSRKLHEIEFDVSEYPSYLSLRDAVISKLKNTVDRGDLLKVVLKGLHDIEFEIDKDGLALDLNDIFFFAKVYDKTELKYDINDYLTNKSVLGEFVRVVHESDMNEQAKRRVIMCGITAMKGEDF